MIMDLRERTSGAADTGSDIRHFVIGDRGPERLIVSRNTTVVSADPEAWVHAERSPAEPRDGDPVPAEDDDIGDGQQQDPEEEG